MKTVTLVLAFVLLPKLLPAQTPAPRIEKNSSGSFQMNVDGQLVLGAFTKWK